MIEGTVYPDKVWSFVCMLILFSFHKPKKDMIEAWCRQVHNGRKDFLVGMSREGVITCSNHSQDGKPTHSNPLPTLFLQHLSTPMRNRRRDAT